MRVGYILAVESVPNRGIALLWPSGHMDRCPPIANLATALARRGYAVDIYTARNRHAREPKLEEPGVRIFFMPGVQTEFREPVMKMTWQFLRWVRPQIERGKYQTVVGVGIRGLMVAARLKKRGLRVGYHCLELYPSQEAKTLARKFFKLLERWAHHKMEFTLVQDPMRAQMLADDNRVPIGSMTLLPVAGLGPAAVSRSDYLHGKLGISRDKKIVLYAGTVDAVFSVAPELVRDAKTWPEDFVLVLHANTVGGETPPSDGRIFYSAEAVPYAEIEKVMSSAWVGLALYRPSDENMRCIGLSSGKLSEYLRYGVPVVVSDLPMMGDLVRDTGCGVAVQNVAEVSAALATIARDYSGFSARAVNCFDQKLAHERYIDGVIAALAGPQPSFER